MKPHKYHPRNFKNDQKAKRELEALRKTGSTDSLITCPLLRSAKTENKD